MAQQTDHIVDTNKMVDKDIDDLKKNLERLDYWKLGYNTAKQKLFTSEEMIEYGNDEIIQSLHQYPTEFETEDVLTPSQIFYPNDVPYCSPKTITTTQGIQWVGKYKWS